MNESTQIVLFSLVSAALYGLAFCLWPMLIHG